MELIIASIDSGPPELDSQLPLVVTLVRQLEGKDRPDYWLASLHVPIRWLAGREERTVTHLVLAARWEGQRIEPGIRSMPIAIAYVLDDSLLQDSRLDFTKCEYIAVGALSETATRSPTAHL